MIADRHIYVDATKTRAVEQGDPDAVYLLAAPGHEVDERVVEQYGLTSSAEKLEDVIAPKDPAHPRNKVNLPGAVRFGGSDYKGSDPTAGALADQGRDHLEFNAGRQPVKNSTQARADAATLDATGRDPETVRNDKALTGPGENKAITGPEENKTVTKTPPAPTTPTPPASTGAVPVVPSADNKAAA